MSSETAEILNWDSLRMVEVPTFTMTMRPLSATEAFFDDPEAPPDPEVGPPLEEEGGFVSVFRPWGENNVLSTLRSTLLRLFCFSRGGMV